VVDLPALVELARGARVKTIVDATFATPINLRPLALGVDLVVHSTTKYLGGHNDIMGGAVIGKRGLVDAIRDQLGTLGAVADPLSAYLLARGIKTLALRLQRQNESALAIATMLERHPAVARVWYPMLPSHPDHAIASRDLAGGGAVVTFEFAGGLAAGTRFVEALTIPKLAPSLGGVESLVEQPALMSYFELAPEERAALGIREGLVRMSVGIEDVADLQADLAAALAAIL
jgi:cystathionine gamma-synthase